MKRFLSFMLTITLIVSLALPAFAADSNIDGGGGGMGQGTGSNSWTPGRDGVRITIVRDSDNTAVSTPIDFSNGTNGDIAVHFGKISKIQYRGSGLSPQTSKYVCFKPTAAIPRIISSSGGNNIAAIRSYFCREGTIRDVATATGFDYDNLISGSYKILLEPVAYFKFNSVMYAMTATEAALLDQVKGGGLRNKMVSLSHKNLSLAMSLEAADLGFPAWGGSTTKATNNEQIISSLGLGIIRFSEPDPEPPKESNVTYRCDTEVITAVTLTTGTEKNPENPAYARFSINGRSYSHTDIYIPEDGGHWVDNSEWVDMGWWEYAWIPYSASLTATMRTKPDEKSPTATSSQMKSVYGLNANVSAQVRSDAPSSDITGMQNVVSYFPEFEYATYWRLLKRLNTGLSSTFEFQKNKYSTYGRSVHFSPVWFPDGRYTTYAECLDVWTPAGMLQIYLTDDISIRGSLFDDWHIRSVK